jgi:wobble nucleotide-excising tRNase
MNGNLQFHLQRAITKTKKPMIKSLVIKNVATYDGTGIHIENLRKVNFIYGTNGCGKTTITKFIDNQEEPKFCDCALEWEKDFPLKTLVYNKDFREQNFGKGNIDGVFTLGQATKEEIEAIEKMQAELLKIKEKGIKKKEALEKLTITKTDGENEFKETVWLTIYKKYEEHFKEAFIGYLRKEAFKTKVIDEHKTNKSQLKTFDELKEKSKTIFGEIPKEIRRLVELQFYRLIEIEEDKLWSKKIIGKGDVEISKLIQELNLNDWVNEGRNYIQETPICPFCQQSTITTAFREQLESYFDKTFTTNINLLNELTEEYNRLAANLIHQLEGIETTEKANLETKLNLETFSAYLKTLSSQFNSNKELIANKGKEPSRSVSLTSVKSQLESIQELILNANKVIDSHNYIVQNYNAEKSDLITAIWRFLADENKVQIDNFNKKEAGLERGISALQKQHSELQAKWRTQSQKIKEANKNVTSVQPSVDEINRILKSFGFLNFEIVPSSSGKNQYQIHREDGTIAESTLSEGEITFITFLYFLQLAKGSTEEDSINVERVLIVDDPISSLDSNILFVISSLLKQIIKKIKKDEGSIKQIIVLTHNVYFHKEASFIDGRKSENCDTHFWILRRNKNVSSIQGYDMKNPIHNSYELLWKELRNSETSNVSVQNLMRRIIENYFKILGQYVDDDLINQFDNHEDQEICRSLICWINDGSHCIPDDLFIEHHESIADKYFDVFRKIFDQMGHSNHYKMMMGEQILN